VNVTIKSRDLIAAVSPDDLATLAPTPTLLPGESLERYQFMRQAILADIAPQSAIEWLPVTDIIELSWEIERYRSLRRNVLDIFGRRRLKRACAASIWSKPQPNEAPLQLNIFTGTPSSGRSVLRRLLKSRPG
jgi:hypothetical protein